MSLYLNAEERALVNDVTEDGDRLDVFWNGVLAALLQRLPEGDVVNLENALLMLPSEERKRVVLRALEGGALPLVRKRYRGAN